MSTDTDSHNGHHAPAVQAKPRKLNLALAELFSDLADEVNEAFPPALDPKKTEHLLNYEAHRIAIGTVDAVLTMFDDTQPPPQGLQEFRKMVVRYITTAIALTDLNPDHDQTVRHGVNRAAQDYKPEVPEEKKRTTKATRPGVPAAKKEQGK